jgi:periplasmic divalent cation tolerance protein
MSEVVVVLTTMPADQRAEELARTLVDERLAACVNVLPPMLSVYRWQGRVDHGAERQLVVKTTQARLAALERRLSQIHPYELPEFLVLPIGDGSEAYLAWVIAQTEPEPQ